LHNDSIERIETLRNEMSEEISSQINNLREDIYNLLEKNTKEIADTINDLSIVISKKEKQK